MLPVLTADQVRKADALTMQHQGISSLELMERAALKCTQWLVANEPRWCMDKVGYVVICGPGNNGGDGLAIARLLAGCGRRVQVLRPKGKSFSRDNELNYKRLTSSVEIIEEGKIEAVLKSEQVLVVDALFGSGLNRPLEGQWNELIGIINSARCPVVSIDLPSGASADGEVWNEALVIRSDITLGLGCLKPAYLFREFGRWIGHLEVLSIGLHFDELISAVNGLFMTEHQDIVDLVPLWTKHAHKGDHGRAGLVAGSPGMFGAAILATRAALKSGAGLVTAVIPKGADELIHITAPEALVRAQGEEVPSTITALGIGPGLGQTGASYFKDLLLGYRGPIILDADALNMLAADRALLGHVQPGTIVTPHPKEFDRLFGPSGSSAQRLARARKEAVERGWVIVLKGAYTAVCAPDGSAYFNQTGDPGMAKGGSGDVLTGLLTGLLARGMAPVEAARTAVWIHGRAGSIAASRIGRDGMTANDVVECLPEAWRELRAAR